MKKHLELFSGTHSFGKVSTSLGYSVVSLDRDLGGTCPFTDYDNSKNHIKEDIMKWEYKKYPPKYFDLITASPVCLWWSNLRHCWIGRKVKAHGDTIMTREIIDHDIDLYGKPMLDKVIEIIEYFKPKHWIIENPHTSKMKYYIAEKYPQYNTYNDFSYCKFSDWGYEKKTRFWHNLEGLCNVLCKKDCDGIVVINKQRLHQINIANECLVKVDGKIIKLNSKEKREKYKNHVKIKEITSVKKHKTAVNRIGGGSNRLERYRIPAPLIEKMLKLTLP